MILPAIRRTMGEKNRYSHIINSANGEQAIYNSVARVQNKHTRNCAFSTATLSLRSSRFAFIIHKTRRFFRQQCVSKTPWNISGDTERIEFVTRRENQICDILIPRVREQGDSADDGVCCALQHLYHFVTYLLSRMPRIEITGSDRRIHASCWIWLSRRLWLVGFGWAPPLETKSGAR